MTGRGRGLFQFQTTVAVLQTEFPPYQGLQRLAGDRASPAAEQGAVRLAAHQGQKRSSLQPVRRFDLAQLADRGKEVDVRHQSIADLTARRPDGASNAQDQHDARTAVGEVTFHAGKGETVQAGTKVMTLGGTNRIPIIVSLFEGQGAWVDRGQKIEVRIPTMPGVEFEGQVDRTDREINFSTRTLPVYAGFSTADPRISYGMLVEVTIHTADRENVLQIPREALIRTGEGSRVIVALGEGRFQPVAIVPGLESGEVVEVVSGLEEGQEIVVSGQFLIDSEASLRASFGRMGSDTPPDA